MSGSILDPLEYYASPGLMTDPKEYGTLFDGLPTEISALCKVVQGVLIHIFWAERQGVKLPDKRKLEVNIRQVRQKLAIIQKMNASPLTVTRPLEERLIGNCRDFSTMLCAMLRYKGVPARARCGFGTYFDPEQNQDHWVCEYWNADQKRWVMVDPQLDALQCQILQIKFDPCDMPLGRFLPAGKAWQLCRAGEADPDRFGIFDLHGMGFILGDLLRDLSSLNKLELLPWDCWGLMEKNVKTLSEKDLASLDRVANLTLGNNSAFPELRSIHENNAGLGVPQTIRSYSATGVQTVDITREDKV